MASDCAARLCAALTDAGITHVDAAEYEAWLHGDSMPSIQGDIAAHFGADGSSSVWASVRAHAAEVSARLRDIRAAGGDADGVQHTVWSALAGTYPLAHKATILLVARTVSSVPESAAGCEDVLMCARAYLALLSIPGASAYGWFEPAALRACFQGIQKCVRFVGQRTVDASAPNSGAERAARARASMVAGQVDDGDEEMPDEELQDDSDFEGSRTSSRRRNPSRATRSQPAGGRKTKRSAPELHEGDDDSDKEFSEHEAIRVVPAATFTSVMHTILDLAVFVRAWTLMQHADQIPFIVDILLDVLMMKDDASVSPQEMATSYAGSLEMLGMPDGMSALTLLQASVNVALQLLAPQHNVPLTTARLICKKLKPLLLLGKSTESSVPTASDAGDAEAAVKTKASVARAAREHARAVRGRAIFFVRCIVGHNLTGALCYSSGSSALPSHVLARLPAVAALLQHLSVGAADMKLDARSVVAQVIVQLRAALPHSLRRAYMRFLTSMSRSRTTAYRMYAVELLGRMLGVSLAASSGVTDVESIGMDGQSDATATAGDVDADARAQLLAELAVPTPAEAAVEAAGYGDDAEEYVAGGDGDDADSEFAAEETAARPSKRRGRRSSIVMMGLNTGGATPARSHALGRSLLDGEATRTPSTTTATLARRASPFYGTPGTLNASRLRPAGVTGCRDPRASVIMALDGVLRRCSDKSPAVRARALSTLAAMLSPAALDVGAEVLRQAQLQCVLLTHVAAASTDSVTGMEGTDTTLPIPGDNAANTSRVLADVSTAGSVAGNWWMDVTQLNTTVSVDLDATSIGGMTAAPLVRIVAAVATSPLVPLLVRRLAADERAAVKRSALAVLAALARSGGFPVMVCTNPVRPDAPPFSDSDPAGYSDALASQRALLESAAGVCGAAAVAWRQPASRVLGLYALQSMSAAATDAALMVRKAALAAVTDAFGHDVNSLAMAQLWCATVLPLVKDPEATVAAKAVELINTSIVEAAIATRTEDDSATPVWQLLEIIANNNDLTSCLSEGIRLLLRTLQPTVASQAAGGSNITFRFVELVNSFLRAAGAPVASSPACGAWLGLHLISKHLASVRDVLQRGAAKSTLAALCTTAREAWTKVLAPMVTSTCITLSDRAAAQCAWCLDTLAHVSSVATIPTAATLSEQLIAGIARFIWPAPVASAALRTVAAVRCRHDAVVIAGAHAPHCHSMRVQMQPEQASWASPVLAAVERALMAFSTVAIPEDVARYAPSLCSVLFVLGELATTGLDSNSSQGVDDRAVTAATGGYAKSIPIPDHIVTLVQALLASEIPVGPLPVNVPLPDAVRAHAYLCLGKLCLRDAALARKYIAVFVRDLSPDISPAAVRNNLVFVLSDLAVRYTALVDRYLPNIAAVTADPHPIVRRHALVALAQLINEDFIKLRAPVFYRLGLALADEDTAVRSVAEAVLRSSIAAKNQKAIAAHFIGLLFVLTGCAALPAYSHLLHSAFAGEDEADGAEWNVGGLTVHSAAVRLRILRAVLSSMTQEQRLTVYGKLASDILGGVSEGELSLSAAARRGSATPLGAVSGATSGTVECLLQDALSLLCTPELRVGGRQSGNGATRGARTSTADDDPEAMFEDDATAAAGGESSGTAAAMAAAARGRLIQKIMRKQVVENVLPVCLGLRQMLAAARSPVMRMLMEFFRVLYEDFQEDISDALASDRQTLLELEYDLRQHQASSAAASATPSALLRMQPISAQRGGAPTPRTAPRAAHRPASALTPAARPPVASSAMLSPTRAALISPAKLHAMPVTQTLSMAAERAAARTVTMTSPEAPPARQAEWRVTVQPSPFKPTEGLEQDAESETEPSENTAPASTITGKSSTPVAPRSRSTRAMRSRRA